ncbi:hypothetical protein [Azospirillum argentinense]
MRPRLSSRRKPVWRFKRPPKVSRHIPRNRRYGALLRLVPIILEVFLALSGPRGLMDWRTNMPEAPIDAPAFTPLMPISNA